jgi:hypothetical protein
MPSRKITLLEIFEEYKSKTLRDIGCVDITYYNTSLETDSVKLKQSEFIIKFVKRKRLFESIVKEYEKEAVSQKIVNEEMVFALKNFPLCHPLDVITDLEKYLYYFNDRPIRDRIARYSNMYHNEMIYEHNDKYFVKYLVYLIIMYAIQTKEIPHGKFYDMPSPKDCIAYKLNYNMLRSENKEIEFLESMEAKKITEKAVGNFIDSVNFDEIDSLACSLLISVRFIEDYFNIFGKDIIIRTTGKKLFEYLNRNKNYDYHYDEK